MTLKVGGRVRFIADNPNGGAGYGRKGQEAVVSGICDYVVHKYGPQVELEPFGALGFSPNAPVSCLELISEGPVRTVTRREVVEGRYACVDVGHVIDVPECENPDASPARKVAVALYGYRSSAELKAAAAVLLELAGALE